MIGIIRDGKLQWMKSSTLFEKMELNWELVSLPPGRKLVQCEWVFQTNFGAAGKKCKKKLRLVSKMKECTIMRPLHQWQRWLHQPSFFHSRIQALGGASHGCQEWFYSWRPEWGHIHEASIILYSDPSLVCKLQKSLYGLKHAPRSWYTKMDTFLLSQNFQRWKYDPNVYL